MREPLGLSLLPPEANGLAGPPLASQLDARRQAKAGSQLADGIRLVYAGGTGDGNA